MAAVERESVASVALRLPERVTFDSQPYTYGAVLVDLEPAGSYNGHPMVSGRVLEGEQRSFLWGHTASKSIAGQRVTIYGVKQWELDRGHIVRVAS